jgi:hypothetical protein
MTMAVVKNSTRIGKKQVSTTAARESFKKPAGNKAKGSLKLNRSKSQKAAGKPSAKFSSLKSKQMAVENAKRTIWASMQKITNALINNASNGNLSTAKELFDFAGVYSLAEPEDENAAVVAQPAPAAGQQTVAEPAKVHPIDLFLDKLGIPPSTAQPESEAA